MKKIKYPALAAAILLLAYCKTAKQTKVGPVAVKEVFVPSAKQLEVANARWANTTVDEIKEGQTIYTIKCTKCHENFEITKFSEKKWIHEINDMSPKAELTPEEKLKLSKHILSYREANTVPKSN